MNYPDFSSTECRRLSIDAQIPSPEIKKPLLDIVGPDLKAKIYFDIGDGRYVSALKVIPNEDNEPLDIEIRFYKVTKKNQISDGAVLESFFKFLIDNKVKISPVFISATFRYMTSKFDSKIQLPTTIPSMFMSQEQDLVIKGIRLELKDEKVKSYSHMIDLYGVNIFHDISFVLEESEFEEFYFKNLLEQINKLSLRLINLKKD